MTPVLQIVLMLGIICAAVAIIYMVVKISRTLDNVRDNLNDLTASVAKTVENIDEIKTQAITSMQTIDKTATEFNGVAEDVRTKIDTIASTFEPLQELAENVNHQLVSPIRSIGSVVGAASKALNAFVSKLTN